MKPTRKEYQAPTRKDWIIGISSLAIYVVVITFGAALLFTDYWYLWLVLVVGGGVILVLRQTKNYACRCRECGEEFEISLITNFISPHGIDKEGSWQWVKCPGCKKRSKATVVKIAKE